ncbi:hypothetical protein [Vagococcus lutrae]|uniref:hypothetical protein n=1 Tax=Vagococcus lutrae TaxID=81947 RepID=UPI00200F5539|nr:hypothetical protein [Vagococcus lutrae]UQF11984.1 hypothetical protein M2919_01265 [Vagococcus lutrae]
MSEFVSKYPILEIPTDTNYWFVRAQSGLYYDDFLENEFIAIGDNDINIDFLKQYSKASPVESLFSLEDTKLIYKQHYPNYNSQQNTLYSKRLFNFFYEMKLNDIVLVPSKTSKRFLIGVITSEAYDYDLEKNHMKENYFNRRVCPFKKRRNVTWIKEINRKDLPDSMYWLLSAHQTFFNLKKEESKIDQLISPIYKKGDRLYSTFHVASEDSLSFDNWLALQNLLSKSSKDKSSYFVLKADINSPGEFKISTGIEHLDTFLYVCSNILYFAKENPILFTSITSTVFLSIFGGPNVNGKQFFGIIPYFFGEGKISREKSRLENKGIDLDNQIKREVLIAKQIKNKKDIKDMEISAYDPGKVIPMKNKKDPFEK